MGTITTSVVSPLAFIVRRCSRISGPSQGCSGPPLQPWLGPDILEHLLTMKARGETTDVVIVPIGFVSDHIEVLYDLDTEARRLCDELGLNMVRAAAVGNNPRFVTMVRELIL